MKTMLTLIMAVLLIVTSGGCSYSTITHGTANATNIRWFWDTTGFEFDAKTTNGNVKIKLQKSNPDAESLKALAEGVAKGAVEGAK